MIGYPKFLNCKQDYLNLLAIPEFKTQTIEDLKGIRDLDDDKALRTVSFDETTGDVITENIDNPMPLWKIKGFSSRAEVAQLIAAQEMTT